MKIHTRKIIIALLVASIMAFAGSAWATEIFNGNRTVTSDGTPRSSDQTSQNNANLRNTDTPAGRVDSASIINTNVLMWPAGGTGYNLTGGVFDAPTTVASSTKGAIYLQGNSLEFRPTFHTWAWADWDGTNNLSATYAVYHTIGSAGDVLRVYDTVGGGKLTIDVSSPASTFSPAPFPTTRLLYTGGTYVESGTLVFEHGNNLGGGVANVFPAGFGDITLGVHNNVNSIPSNLVVNATGLVTNNFLVRNEIAELTPNQNVTIHNLTLDTYGTALKISTQPTTTPVAPAIVATVFVDTSYAVKATGDVTLHVNGKGKLDFMTTPLNTGNGAKTIVDLTANGSTVRTAATGTQTIKEIKGSSAGNIGTLQAHATTGTLTIGSGTLGITGAPIIDIPSATAVVSVPSGISLTAVQQRGQAPLQGGTLKVRSSSNPLSFLDNPALFDTPRLDIDSGAVINDLRTSSVPATRTFNGLNGTGRLNMTSNPAALNLTPYIDSDYNYAIQASVTTLSLNAQNGVQSPVTQVLRASNSTITTYNINTGAATEKGVLRFTSPAAVRTGTGAFTTNIGATGTLALDFVQNGYDFTGSTNPSGILNVVTGSTINLAPSSSNTAKDLTALATTPATLRVVTYSGAAHPSPLNINLDMSKIYAGTGYIKLVSDTANIGTMLVPGDLNVVSLTAGVTINNVYVDAAGDFIYIGYTSTLNPGGGGGGDPDPISKDISIDMTPILNTVKSDDLFIINRVDGTSENYDLSKNQLIINAGVEDVLTVTNVGSLFTITYDHSPIYSGAKIVVTLTDAQGNKTSYNTTASIINGHSILDFDALGLASGKYDIRIDSPAGSNPRYTGPVTYAYEYTAPAGAPVFTMTSGASERTVTASATIAGDSPVSGVTVTFMITNSTGAVIGTAKTAVTGSDGKTPNVTFGDNLVDGTYTVTATTDNYGTKTSTVTVKGSGKSGGSSGGCDAGFGAFALLAMAGGALVLRKKG